MSQKPRRTGKTSLSDDELLILDAMCYHQSQLKPLRRDYYSIDLNVPYSHDLSDDDLLKLLQFLVAKGWLETHEFDTPVRKNITAYGFTETGGQLWELERQPDWDKYCEDSVWDEEYGSWVLSVQSPSLATVTAFLQTAHQCLVYDFDPNQSITKTYSMDKDLVYWKVFPQVYDLRVPLKPSYSEWRRIDWATYHTKRTWWRTISELSTLV